MAGSAAEQPSKTSVGVDLQVLSEKKIVKSLKRIAEKDAGKRFLGLYNLLRDSRLRLTEAIKLFNALKFGSAKLIQNGNAVPYVQA